MNMERSCCQTFAAYGLTVADKHGRALKRFLVASDCALWENMVEREFLLFYLPFKIVMRASERSTDLIPC
jgi:hypothetical protein